MKKIMFVAFVVSFYFGWHIDIGAYAQGENSQATEIVNQVARLDVHSPITPAFDQKKIFQRSSGFKVDLDSRKDIKEDVYAEYQLYAFYGTGEKYITRMAKYDGFIQSVAKEYQMDADIIYGHGALESRGNARAYGKLGEQGLMQILDIPPLCWQNVKKRLKKKSLNDIDLYNPWENLHTGLIALKYYTSTKKNDLLLGLVAYNWGPNRRTLKNKPNFMSVRNNLPKEVRRYPMKVYALTLIKKVKEKHGEVLLYDLKCDNKYKRCLKKSDQQTCEVKLNACETQQTSNRQAIEEIALAGIDY